MQEFKKMTTVDSSVNDNQWEPLRLTYLKPSFNSQEVALAARQNVWHKFIIFNCGFLEKSELLKAIINACEPENLLPVMYKVETEQKRTFLARCNASAIENLVKQNLCVPFAGREIQLDIVLGFLATKDLQLNPNRVVAQALYYRYEPVKRILNLEDFENEKRLCSIFCPISAPKIFHFVLRCTKIGILGNNRDSRLPIRELNLKHNKITSIILFEKFFYYNLTKLDLRYNLIHDVEYLRYFSEHKITELWLDGNPLCTKYDTPQDYIQAVKTIFPHLQKLDGIVIGIDIKSVPGIQNNYLGNGLKLPLIKQFVKHFFTLYDQEDRIVMNGLYHRDALYSMTLGNITNYSHKQMTKMFATNRNLLKFVDYAKCHEFLLQGPERIISTLRYQPPTIHSFSTFHIDLLHEGENYLAVSVQGLFSYRDMFCPPLLFNRTFIIVKKEDNEYCIVNDQYYIDGSLGNSSTAGSSEVKIETKAVPKFIPTVLSVSERDQLVTFLHELTTMKKPYCRKYLDNLGWDIRSAITTFMQMYTVNDIPPEAFS